MSVIAEWFPIHVHTFFAYVTDGSRPIFGEVHINSGVPYRPNPYILERGVRQL
jgi:hypothetical protein